jgi:2-amino-4-hydroxy-6-hydroxymethyldihydropteridine diphosphokinase
MKKAFISLGTNIGDRNKNLAKAIQYINVGIGHIIDLSGVYETEPWGFESSDKFLNMVIEVLSDLTPEEMLPKCLEIEQLLGRVRSTENGYISRTIDIDILFFADVVISSDLLTIPHPHIADRRFVLEPLAEIAPDYVHPILGKNMKELLNACSDQTQVCQLGSLNGEF